MTRITVTRRCTRTEEVDIEFPMFFRDDVDHDYVVYRRIDADGTVRAITHITRNGEEFELEISKTNDFGYWLDQPAYDRSTGAEFGAVCMRARQFVDRFTTT